MELGISSYTFTWAIGVRGYPPPHPLGPLDLMRKAHQLGVQVVQFADNLPLDRLSPHELNHCERAASELGLSVEVGTRGIGADRLRTYLDLALRLRSPIVRVVIDTVDRHPSEAEAVAAFRSVVHEFDRAGVCLAIENHDRFKVRTLLCMLTQIDSANVGICLDTANSLGALEGPEVAVTALAPRTVNLHLKDFTIRRSPHNMGFIVEGCPVGQGRLDVPWLLDTLRSHGRDPNAILEQWTPPEGDLQATIAKEERWAIASIEYLRTLIAE